MARCCARVIQKHFDYTLPKYTSSAVSRNLKPCAAAYNEIADKFVMHDAAVLATGASMYKSMATMGTRAWPRRARRARRAQWA